MLKNLQKINQKDVFKLAVTLFWVLSILLNNPIAACQEMVSDVQPEETGEGLTNNQKVIVAMLVCGIILVVWGFSGGVDMYAPNDPSGLYNPALDRSPYSDVFKQFMLDHHHTKPDTSNLEVFYREALPHEITEYKSSN